MVSSIRKRDARIVPFDVNKIAQAIFRAASSQGGKDYVLSLKIAAEVLERLNEQFEDAVPDVEQVQDLVEKTLIKSGHARTAKAYILYRHQRTKIREMNTRLMTTIRDLTFKDAKDNDLKRENANIDGDTAMGMMLRYGSESSKQFYEMYILNPNLSEEETAALVEKFKTLVEQNGTLDEMEEMGKRKLAYEINYLSEGYYVLVKFTSAPEFPAELDRILGITDGVIRSLITKRPE